jgi:hypothetical protein
MYAEKSGLIPINQRYRPDFAISIRYIILLHDNASSASRSLSRSGRARFCRRPCRPSPRRRRGHEESESSRWRA